MQRPTTMERHRGRLPLLAVRSGLHAALLAALVAAAAGLGSRLGLWHFRSGFTLLTWAAYGGLAAALLSILAGAVAVWQRRWRSTALALLGLAVGATIFAVPLSWRLKAASVPPIHDLSTDTERPPAFVAVLPLRQGAPNPAAYGGPEVARQQRAAYPDLQPLTLALSPPVAFDRALAVARALGWRIVAAVPAEGRIEASATTFWFGFRDDIVVRIVAADSGSRVDIRSLSRVGRGDAGTNAERIRAFLQRLKEG